MWPCDTLMHLIYARLTELNILNSLSFSLTLSFSFLVVSVELQVPAPVAEGADFTVCTTLTFLGDTTTLECDIAVNMETIDGTKAGRKVVRQRCQ